MFFTPQQINEIIAELQKTNWLFIAHNINPALLPESVMQDLIRSGFRPEQIIKFPELAFQFGVLSTHLKKAQADKITLAELKKQIKTNKILPLSETEKNALQIIEQRAVNGITGLGNKMSSDLQTIIIEGDIKKRRQYEKIIKETSKQAIEKRETKKWLANEIANKTGDWSRDLDRIADFILHEAYDNGRAFSIRDKYGDTAKVYKRVHKDACKHCKKLYLINTKTNEPKIFLLKTLLDNGTNIGVPAKDWKPVIGATHPWCRCDLEYVMDNYAWDKKQTKFEIKKNPKNKYDIDFKVRKYKS
jgi:hypothetical protein